MRRYVLILMSFFVFFIGYSQQSTRRERNFIVEGNEFYNNKQYKNAIEAYNKALQENPSSVRASYNRALAMIQLGQDENLKDQKLREQYLKDGVDAMETISKLSGSELLLAAKANYNLGNIAFKTEDYRKAIELYKQSLRLDPTNENARRNLRIAQKKLKDQEGGGNNNQQQEQNEENQAQEQQQNQQEQQQSQDQEQQPQEESMSNQTAEQILNAMENKENNTRQRVQNAIKKSQQQTGSRRPQKKW